MEPKGFRLSTRITATALFILAVGAMALMLSENARLQDAYLGERSEDMGEALYNVTQRLDQEVTSLQRDAKFLSSIPPVFGIMRAALNHGYDARDGNTREQWEVRMNGIFSAFLQANPAYYRISYIGAADGGRELLRLDNRAGNIEAMPSAGLQALADRDYFQAGLKLRGNQVWMSDFNFERESDDQHTYMLRVVVPVFSAPGKIFGMVVISMDVRELLESATLNLPPGAMASIANMDGRYLLYNDVLLNLAASDGRNIVADFPTLKMMLEPQGADNLPLQAAATSGGNQYLAARRIHFDPNDREHFLLLVYGITEDAMAQQANNIPPKHIAIGFIMMLLLGGAAILTLRRTFAPLKQITLAADKIMAGDHNIHLPQLYDGEIGSLSRALNTMLDKLLQREDEFRKELAESLPGIFYTIDAAGKFLMWNRNLELALHCSAEELAGSHPLDFFDGADAIRIAEAIRTVFESGEVAVDAMLVARDGSRVPYHFTGRRIVRNGELVLVGMGVDMSEYRRILSKTETLLRRTQVLMQNSMEGIHVMDIDGNILEANNSFCSMLGYTQEEITRMNVVDWETQWSAGESRENFKSLMGKNARFETAYRRKDGSLIMVEICSCGMEVDGKGYFFNSSRDITERKRADSIMLLHKRVVETAMDGFWRIDVRGNLIETNEAYERMSGYTIEELMHMHISELEAQASPHEIDAHMAKIIAQGHDRFETRHRCKDGRVMDIEMSATFMTEIQQFFVFSRDITRRKLVEEEIRSLAFYDVLTKLPNRRLFLDHLRAALVASVRRNDYGAVLFIDMDRFKLLNDTFGHEYGDLLLIEVAARIKSCVREMDTVARMGGDEFVVLVEELSDVQDAALYKVGLVAEKIREALAEPYQLKGHECHSSPSIGISLYCGNEMTIDTLLQQADMAMYQAKGAGRNTICFFDPVMQHNVTTRNALEQELHRAIGLQQLCLHYQVQVDNEHRPVGAEALLRWLHPQRGLLLPDQFIPIAEEGTLIFDIGHWVLDQACRQLAIWAGNERLRGLTLGVNISAKQFAQPDFVEQVIRAMQAHGVTPSAVKLELAESLMLHDLNSMARKMQELKALGIKLSMDNFGKGYLALLSMKGILLDQVKIDRSFMQGITRGANDAQLVSTIIALAEGFHLEVIAEGVETEAQLAFLKHHECTAYQGFLFSKPVAVEELEELLERLWAPR
ncbi:MAG: EAL domain-containing protein [Nitrosomonadales bacterium]|nr:EAL domain-containing protein [Nitrosomonadales bacterium]